jgi:very-short-patch-repair endonuclease
MVDDVWCTPLARTACDVVRTADPVHGLAQLDAALHTRRISSEELRVEAGRHVGLRGAKLLTRLAPWADGRAGSFMESRMRWRCLEGGLPAPDLQVRVGDDVSWREMDVGWRRQRVGAEFDGLVAHMTAEQLRSDRERHNWLTEHGWTLLHFTAADVYTRHEAMVATIARALRRNESGVAGATRGR